MILILSKIIFFIGRIKWDHISQLITGKAYGLTWEDHLAICQALSREPLIILTRRKTHLSTYMIGLAHWFLTGRFGHWSHVAINVETTNVVDQASARILEAVGSGVQISPFYSVFNCDSVCLLRPRVSRGFDWDKALHEALENRGKPYDDFFNLGDDSSMSCVELVLDALKSDPDYEARFHGLEAMIKNEGNLTPEMFYESGSFDCVLEVRR